MIAACLVGYDPGGDQSHGLALCEVTQVEHRWCPQFLQIASARTVLEAVAWVVSKSTGARLLAVGLDTLTEWN